MSVLYIHKYDQPLYHVLYWYVLYNNNMYLPIRLYTIYTHCILYIGIQTFPDGKVISTVYENKREHAKKYIIYNLKRRKKKRVARGGIRI